jgi:hypothetical protein
MCAIKSKSDWVARIFGGVSLLLSLFTLYCTVLQEPTVSVSVGQHVLVNKKPRIGVLCTFVNEGAKQTVVTSAQLRWDQPSVTFNSEMTSTSFEQWEFDDKGNIETVVRSRYTPIVAPIPIKRFDQASTMFWFTSTDSAFAFSTGEHTVILTIMSGSTKMSEKRLRIVIDDSVIGALNDPHNPPAAEYRVEVVGQE